MDKKCNADIDRLKFLITIVIENKALSYFIV